jgi:hypothetical protein
MKSEYRIGESDYFFFLANTFPGNSLDSWDFILAALFLWSACFLAALSVREVAAIIFAAVLPFLAERIAASSLLKTILLIDALTLLPLRALLALLVTGMVAV